jgi:hypothetical protein
MASGHLLAQLLPALGLPGQLDLVAGGGDEARPRHRLFVGELGERLQLPTVADHRFADVCAEERGRVSVPPQDLDADACAADGALERRRVLLFVSGYGNRPAGTTSVAREIARQLLAETGVSTLVHKEAELIVAHGDEAHLGRQRSADFGRRRRLDPDDDLVLRRRFGRRFVFHAAAAGRPSEQDDTKECE